MGSFICIESAVTRANLYSSQVHESDFLFTNVRMGLKKEKKSSKQSWGKFSVQLA